jgi:HPt (histidine-containing phosphotransfer) domain-containing protein
MPLHLERIDWMPSPPLAPDDGPIDLGHLKRMTAGDPALAREVLALFASQTAGLIEALGADLAGGAGLAHTLKGSARAIGAFALAKAAEAFENAMHAGEGPAGAFAALKLAVGEARAAIDVMLKRS